MYEDQAMLSKFGGGDTDRLNLSTDTFEASNEVREYLDSIDVLDDFRVSTRTVRLYGPGEEPEWKLEHNDNGEWAAYGPTSILAGSNPPAHFRKSDLQHTIDEAVSRIHDEVDDRGDQDENDRADDAMISEQCRAITKGGDGDRCTNAVSHMGSSNLCGPHQNADHVVTVDEVEDTGGVEDE